MSQTAPTVASVALHDAVEERPQNVLINLAGTAADRRFVRENGAYALHTGGALVLLSVMPSREFAGRREARLCAGCRRYTLCQAEEDGRRVAARAGRAVCSSLSIGTIVVGVVGNETDHVLAVSREHDCGHVFSVDRQPSGFRRLVGGDAVRTVTDEFDGLITVRRETVGT